MEILSILFVVADPRLTDYETLLDNIHGLKDGKSVQVPIYDFKSSTRIGYRYLHSLLMHMLQLKTCGQTVLHLNSWEPLDLVMMADGQRDYTKIYDIFI